MSWVSNISIFPFAFPSDFPRLALTSHHAQQPVGPAAAIDDRLSSFSSLSTASYGILTTIQSHKNLPKIAPKMIEMKMKPLNDMTSNISKYATPNVIPWIIALTSCCKLVARNVAKWVPSVFAGPSQQFEGIAFVSAACWMRSWRWNWRRRY